MPFAASEDLLARSRHSVDRNGSLPSLPSYADACCSAKHELIIALQLKIFSVLGNKAVFCSAILVSLLLTIVRHLIDHYQRAAEAAPIAPTKRDEGIKETNKQLLHGVLFVACTTSDSP